MKGHGQKLTARQERLIAALLTEPTYEDAARKAGVGETTLYRWLAVPAFAAAYRAARQDVLERAVARLLALCGKALAALEDNLGAEKASDRNKAALGILDRAVRGVELLDLAARVAALEGRG